MQPPRPEYVDILIDDEHGELLSVSVVLAHACLQWHNLPTGGLGAMREFLASPTGNHQELTIGSLFGNPLVLVEDEGRYSFKSREQLYADLMRLDLSPADVAGLLAALVDAIDTWED